MTATEEANVRLVRKHFAAESTHDYDAWWDAFPDVTIEVQRVSAAGEWVVAECVAAATHQGTFMGVPPTGKRVTARVCTLIRMHAGKMVEEAVYDDRLERLAQIGSVLELDGHRVVRP
jgi:predicted ester cyclase